MPDSAEIEAVARALNAASRMAQGIFDIRMYDGRSAWDGAEIARADFLTVESEARAVLSRVRDARGDDEVLRAAAQAVLSTRFSSSFAEINRALDRLDSALRGAARSPQALPTDDDPPIGFGDMIDTGPARSPQGEDHEAGIEAAWDREAEELTRGQVEAIINAYLSYMSPSRDGTVAVEDVEKLAKTLYDVGAWLSSGDFAGWEVVVREIEGVLAEFGSARAGESNEGGNQNDGRRR